MLVYIEIKKSLKIHLPLSRSKVFGCLSLIRVPLLILRMLSCTNFEKFTLEFFRTPETLGNASQFFLRLLPSFYVFKLFPLFSVFWLFFPLSLLCFDSFLVVIWALNLTSIYIELKWIITVDFKIEIKRTDEIAPRHRRKKGILRSLGLFSARFCRVMGVNAVELRE